MKNVACLLKLIALIKVLKRTDPLYHLFSVSPHLFSMQKNLLFIFSIIFNFSFIFSHEIQRFFPPQNYWIILRFLFHHTLSRFGGFFINFTNCSVHFSTHPLRQWGWIQYVWFSFHVSYLVRKMFSFSYKKLELQVRQ